ncbi:MAG: hypothetical protein HZA59_07890, partial [Hydrogenophilales bacterium]|nr:hypothetical protein [Hydrogenophilales bacterium]
MLGYIIFFLLLVWCGLLGFYASDLRRRWREPVLRYPVLVIESDDWGAGPLEQAQALDALRQILQGHRDQMGRHPVMTVGVILGIVDRAAMAAASPSDYVRLTLDDARQATVLTALRAGIKDGVMAPQLHGLEHYWPPALMAAAEKDGQVAAWLVGDGMARSEDLPSHLQSRWTNAAALPSRPIPEVEINQAAAQETEIYAQIFGVAPTVAVPTTFVWNDAVERAWATHGVACIVTPGTRHENRDRQGRPSGDGRTILNGEHGSSGVLYLVRDNYFEPALGHRAENGLAALARQTALGRPTLLETHRFNVLCAPTQSEVALGELNRLLAEACARYPTLRFLATQNIAEAMARDDRELLETEL